MKKRILGIAIMGIIPVLSCILFCALQGCWVNDVYLPNTKCSDDIFYFKMTEGMVNYGNPLGYFGYNESHALVSSYGVWSPVLLWAWAILGKVFGWNFMAPILYNICFVSVGFAIFTVLAKPSYKQIIMLGLLFVAITPYTRYMLSGMPEAVCYMLMLIMYGLIYSYFRDERDYKIVGLFIIITLLTLMRPYFMVLLVFPGIFWIRKSKVIGSIGTLVVLFLNLLGYWLMLHFYSAPYFYSSMATDFIYVYKEEGFFTCVLFLIGKIHDKWMDIRWNMSRGIREGFVDGQIYFVCFLMMLILFLCLVCGIKAKKQYSETIFWENIVLNVGQMFSLIVMLLAIMVLYQIPEGSRHILMFLLGAIVICAMNENLVKRWGIVLVICMFLFWRHSDGSSGYIVPYYNVETRLISVLREEIGKCLEINYQNIPSYDNTIDWVIEDSVLEGESEIAWDILFALPDGTGINCCLATYVIDNIDNLSSRYIVMVPEGKTDHLCKNKNFEEIYRDNRGVIYKRY